MLMNFAAKATEVDLVKMLYNVSLPYKQFKTRGHHCTALVNYHTIEILSS